jgi:transposase-like protein
VFGEVPVQRCLWHKERNVLGHLPERDRPQVKARMRRAWRETNYERALEQLTRLADELEHTHPGAAGSLREGMDETLTVIRLGIRGKLRRTLESTNACESMIDTVRTTQRNVKHWFLRRDGAALDRRRDARSREAVPQGDRLHRPAAARGRDRTTTPPSPAQPPTNQEAAISVTV